MKGSFEKIAALTGLTLFCLTACVDSVSMNGAPCPCIEGYVCCDGVCRTSCDGNSTSNDSEDKGDTVIDINTDSNAETDEAGGTDSEEWGATALPCDIFETAGYPCVSAHSMVRLLRSGYTGPLYELCRGNAERGPNSCQGDALDIRVVEGGYADAAAHTDFCAGRGDCTVTKLYDQAAHAGGPPNDLEPAPPGGAKATPDNPAKANELPVLINGHKAYGMIIRPGIGYRAGCSGCNTPIGTDLAIDDDPQTIYMITSMYDTINGCCFNYGNAETTCNADGNGNAEAVYFGMGVIWGSGSGEGPWVMADLEFGLYPGWDSVGQSWDNISSNTPLLHDFVTAVVVGDTADQNNGKGRFALYGGDATQGGLEEKYDGIRPEKTGYVPMRKQGSLVLGISGDNSNAGGGRFYEGAVVNTPLDKSTLDDLQAAVVAARYGR